MTRLSSSDLLSLTNTAITAATLAGEIINEHQGQKLSIQNKIGGNTQASQVVTEIDYLSQKIILKTLQNTCKTFDLAILTEESEDDKRRLEKDYFWSIDPLDGTLPFIESVSGYAVSIALVSRAGLPFIGVIYDPLKKTLYHAIKGRGAFRNQKPWSLNSNLLTDDAISDVEQTYLTVVSDRSFIHQNNYRNIMASLASLSKQLGLKGIKTIQHGGAAMNACWVLENNPGCYFKFPKPQDGGGSLWDYAASSCLFKEIGAIASDIYGEPLKLNRSDSTFMNHRGIVFATHKTIATGICELYKEV